MSRAKKGLQKVPILKEMTGLYPSSSYYSMQAFSSAEIQTFLEQSRESAHQSSALSGELKALWNGIRKIILI